MTKPPKRGRPTKPETAKLTQSAYAKFSPEEYEAIAAIAAAEGRSVASWLRMAALEKYYEFLRQEQMDSREAYNNRPDADKKPGS